MSIDSRERLPDTSTPASAPSVRRRSARFLARHPRVRLGFSLGPASADLGADGLQTFRYVTFPLLRSALLAGGYSPSR